MRIPHYDDNGLSLGARELTSLPGSSQVVVSHGAFINKAHRGKGVGNSMHQQTLAVAKELAYDYIMCTVAADNAAQISILEKNHWKKLDQFFSEKTEHWVELWGKAI